jgi:3-methyl-2-oxobutanoate hydroxymethyltransferase
MSIQDLQLMRDKKQPITMLTAYDYSTARACSSYGVDLILLGDSLAQVCLGYDSTTHLTLDDMIHHAKAVRRGCGTPFLVGDMPFGTYEVGPEDAVRNAMRYMREGRVEGVKLEGGLEVAETVRRMTSVGIPVMAHVGLMPQRYAASSGYKVQGRDVEGARSILRSALALQDAGAFAIVLEAIPRVLGEYITSRLRIPTIGIGAGSETSGQVLVWDDVMTTWEGHKPKFVRRFADVRGEVEKGVRGYIEAVKERRFPERSESYKMDSGEWERVLELEGDRRWQSSSTDSSAVQGERERTEIMLRATGTA